MREKFQRFGLALLLAALVTVGSLACLERAGMWHATTGRTQDVHTLESVDTTVAFATTYHYGELRHFDGMGVGLSMTCHTEGEGAAENTFVVELHRMVLGLVDVQVGSAVVPREGDVFLTWDNAGSGDFFFRFVKAPDGQVISADDVQIFSFE